MVEIYIGTPARRKYYLVMDTASDILWMQCKPCIRCWKQSKPIFHPVKESSSFDPIRCNHTLCDLGRPGWKCVKGQCHYSIGYGDGSSSKGILAFETLGFASDRHQKEFVRNFIFGCANDNRDPAMTKEQSGVFGLNMEPLSLARQLLELIGGRFSYCLPPFKSNKQPLSRLKFGDEAILRGPQVRTIRIIHAPTLITYLLPLSDVSVAGHRLGFKSKDFAIHKNDHGNVRGGFIIDSGTSFTAFKSGGPYERIIETFKAYFEPFKLRPTNSELFEVCYVLPHEGFKETLPSMTLHFSGGVDYLVPPNNVVVKLGVNKLCVAIRSFPEASILGERNQFNYHFSYNIKEKLLSFAPADCSRVV
uniref:Peptidase A1 domain-containing protein n=1 Tax=Ananas comosus var. bracteatus TaxID=296719 RepID=A0A6V7Q0X0_ANACO|nr:unnamed protein product [Ananas comosus var. bracteatus]